MDLTLFLAKAFGLYFVIGGLGLVLKQSAMKAMITQFSSDRASVMMGGFVALLIGIPLVLVHNLWGTTLESIVSIIVWLTFLKGVMRVLMPDMVVKMARSLSSMMSMINALLWLMVVLGGYLLYVGFGM